MTSLADDLIERARSSDLLGVAQRYGARLKKVGSGEYAGPCPRCGGKDRFSINTRKGLWNCRGCGVGGDVIALVRHFDGLQFREAVERLTGETWTPTRRIDGAKARNAVECDSEDKRRQHEKALWLWGRKEPLTGSIAERYVREARAYKGRLPPSLAFLRAYKEHPPALICAFAPPPGETEPEILAEPRNVQAVQLIALKPDGSGKAEVEVPKRTIGAHKGLPIVVSPVNDGLGLSIHEGVEDALSAAEATNLGCWASGGATFLPALANAVPSYVETVTIGEHNDKSGQNGARELARLLCERGINVLLGGADG